MGVFRKLRCKPFRRFSAAKLTRQLIPLHLGRGKREVYCIPSPDYVIAPPRCGGYAHVTFRSVSPSKKLAKRRDRNCLGSVLSYTHLNDESPAPRRCISTQTDESNHIGQSY